MESGGFSDRPEDAPDVYHTFFAICGLSLLDDDLVKYKIDSVYCLPSDLLQGHFQQFEANKSRK